jgi:hypothetical protein
MATNASRKHGILGDEIGVLPQLEGSLVLK